MSKDNKDTLKTGNIVPLFREEVPSIATEPLTGESEEYENYLAFLLTIEAESDFSHLDDLKEYLLTAVGQLDADHDNLVATFGPEFGRAAGPLTGIHLPLRIVLPYNLWTLIIADYKQMMFDIDRKRYLRLTGMAAGKPDPDSQIHYMLRPEEADRELDLFSRHLLANLTSYRKMRQQVSRRLPELSIRPSIRVHEEIVSLNAYINCRDRENGPDIRKILHACLTGNNKNRGHLRAVPVPGPGLS